MTPRLAALMRDPVDPRAIDPALTAAESDRLRAHPGRLLRQAGRCAARRG
ncbi:MAG: hypothetical protein ACK4OP_12335 [Gemmobacter sp.]